MDGIGSDPYPSVKEFCDQISRGVELLREPCTSSEILGDDVLDVDRVKLRAGYAIVSPVRAYAESIIVGHDLDIIDDLHLDYLHIITRCQCR